MKNIAYILILFNMIHLTACQSPGKNASAELFEKDNLIAWCIVPFDAAERGPEARAKMLGDLGISQLAYDYRDEHIPSFKREIEYKC